MEWTIQTVAEASGISSRTLRHYDQIGLLVPSGTTAGGMRTYDQQALVRLQRILLLRETGLGLARIADVLDGTADDATALRGHREQLFRERARITDQIAAVDATIAAITKKETLMPNDMFDGFDHNKYDSEVRERWGDDAADRSQKWWNSMNADAKEDFRKQVDDLNDAWDAVITSGEDATSAAAQTVAAQHVAWLGSAWGGTTPEASMVKGLADMYVADERFAANYNRASETGPQFVRDALHRYADTSM